MDSSGSPGTGNSSSTSSANMIAAPAIGDSPDTQQSASSGISRDHSNSSWRNVSHTLWSKDENTKEEFEKREECGEEGD